MKGRLVRSGDSKALALVSTTMYLQKHFKLKISCHYISHSLSSQVLPLTHFLLKSHPTANDTTGKQPVTYNKTKHCKLYSVYTTCSPKTLKIIYLKWQNILYSLCHHVIMLINTNHVYSQQNK